MVIRVYKRVVPFRTEWTPPADKSISHRALFMGALVEGTSVIKNILDAGDVRSTFSVLRQLGVSIETYRNETRIKGRGLYGFYPASDILDVGNSGTTLRLLTAILSAQSFNSMITGDASLQRRPMKVLVEALRARGGNVKGEGKAEEAPIMIEKPNHPFSELHFESPLPSAQYKSAVLLSGLFSEASTYVREVVSTRDHTEQILLQAGAEVTLQNKVIQLIPHSLKPISLMVPGDLSSAAFLITLALLIPHSHLVVKSVGLNPTRTGFLEIIHKMGAEYSSEYIIQNSEPMGHLEIKSSSLKGITIDQPLAVRAIDELPLVVLLATQAEGITHISGVEMLRRKETDRIKVVAQELRKMKAHIEETPDGWRIEGPSELKGTYVNSFGDHRMAMMLYIAGLLAEGETGVQGMEFADISFPGFLNAVNLN